MTDVTELAHGQINASGDSIAIELVEPTNNRSMIMIRWPNHATIVQPAQYTATAAEIMKILAYAGTRYAQTRAQRRC
jgi:hypothetical protein